MIEGCRFETYSMRPVVDCFLSIAGLNAHGPVAFLLDTGADQSLLMPADARRLKIDYTKITFPRTSHGIGGECREGRVPAQLLVSDSTTVYGYRFPLGIAEPKDYLEDCPSILGMDILRNWRVLCDYRAHLLQIEVRLSDEERPV
jgi:gag-polyprotein putative aspartyl protease